MGISTVRGIVRSVPCAIWEEIQPEMMPAIDTAYSWNEIAKGFEKHW